MSDIPNNGIGAKGPYKKKLYPYANESNTNQLKTLMWKEKTIGLIILMTKGFLKQDTAHITHKGKDW